MMVTEKIEPIRLIDVQSSAPETGLLRQVLAYSPQMMLVRHLMEKGGVGARHSHPREQMVYIIRGHLRLGCGEAEFDARAGDSFIVPGGVEHQASAVEASEALDVFTPYRERSADRKQ